MLIYNKQNIIGETDPLFSRGSLIIKLKEFLKMNQQMQNAKIEFSSRKAMFTQINLKQGIAGDIYGSHAMLHLFNKTEVQASNEVILNVAQWFELPHPKGRAHQGEVDFAAIRMIRVLYQSDKLLTAEVKDALMKFYLTKDFCSNYGSENHALMFHVSRYLAAQYYPGETFIQYGKSASELLISEGDYLREFIIFRARYGWGEFDSCGYAGEIMLILMALYDFCTDKSLKQLAQMMLDLILMDMSVDCLDGLYGGAHGRIYENSAMDYGKSGMFSYYCLYFGSPYIDCLKLNPHSEACVSNYIPADVVYEIALGRSLPYENREAKNLHCAHAWHPYDINWEILGRTRGRISKYTYITPEYVIGAVNKQDDYPDRSEDSWYAHHQQHEWDLTLSGGTDIKIFGHHAGIPDYNKTHGYWTGDVRCCCGTFFCNKNIALSMYDIQKENELDFIHLRVPFKAFEKVEKKENLLLLERKGVYVALHFTNGYEIVTEGDYAMQEVKSHGRKLAIVCEVGLERDYGNMANFVNKMGERQLVFDKETMTLNYENMFMTKETRRLNGQLLDIPYDTYECPYLKSKWDSGVIHVIYEGKTTIYDFNKSMCFMQN